MTLSRSSQCRAFSRALMDEKSSPLFPVGVCAYGRGRGAVFTNVKRINKNNPLIGQRGITTYRNGTDRNEPTKIPKRTSMGTETDRNGLQWVPKRTGAASAHTETNFNRNQKR